MLEEKIMLTPEEILDKAFKIDARGYRPQEVDKYLDIIIRDYSEFMTIVRRYEHEMQNIISDNEKLRREIRNYKDKLDIIKSSSNSGVNNVDILKRISELEKVVYGE